MPGVYCLLSVEQFRRKMLEMYPDSTFTVIKKVRLVMSNPARNFLPVPALANSKRVVFLEDEGVYVKTKPMIFPPREGGSFAMEMVEEDLEGRNEDGSLMIVGDEVRGKYNDTVAFSFSVVSASDYFARGSSCYVDSEDVFLTCEPPRFSEKKLLGGVSKKLQDLIAECCGSYYT